MDNEGGEDMEARHLREKNELQEKVAELKKSIQKADKKKKKEVDAEILRLEGDLNEKHSAEIMFYASCFKSICTDSLSLIQS